MSGKPSVVALDEQATRSVTTATWAELAQNVLAAEGVSGDCELNLTFIDVDEMSALNIEHMEGTGPTDVLSFPLDDSADVVFPDQTRLLGDIMICPKVVAEQAPSAPDEEMALMVVHGVLHILGMDHQEPEEEAQMKAAEQRHLTLWREQS